MPKFLLESLARIFVLSSPLLPKHPLQSWKKPFSLFCDLEISGAKIYQRESKGGRKIWTLTTRISMLGIQRSLHRQVKKLGLVNSERDWASRRSDVCQDPPRGLPWAMPGSSQCEAGKQQVRSGGGGRSGEGKQEISSERTSWLLSRWLKSQIS